MLVLGQSNAANHARVGSIPPLEGDTVFSFFRGRCYKLADPLPGASGSGVSIWSLAVPSLSVRLGRPIVIIVVAEMNRNIADWSRHGGFADLAAGIAADAVQKGLMPAVAIWMHGETDAAIGTNGEEYAEGLRTVVRKIQAGAKTGGEKVTLRWIITRMTRCSRPAMTAAGVRNAQEKIALEMNSAFSGPDLDQFGEEFRYDGCHFNEIGRQRVSDVIEDAVINLVTGEDVSLNLSQANR